MALNELDRLTMIEALKKANASLEIIAVELTKIKQQLYAILRDIQD